MGALDCSVEELELGSGEVRGFGEEFGEEGVCKGWGEEVVDQGAGGVGCYGGGGVEVEGLAFLCERLGDDGRGS